MRITTLTTPLGADISGDILVFREATGTEGMNQLFDYEITMHSATAGIAPKDLLGKPMTLGIDDQHGTTQHINGVVFAFESLGGDYRRTLYRAKIAPWLALTKLSADARIFQNMTVVDIVMQVLGKYPFPVQQKLNDSYPKLVFTVQYNETDFAFVSRLLERFGIGYYFDHTATDHTLVLTDQMSVYTPIAGHETIHYRLMDHMDVGGEENIHRWHRQQSIKPGSYATDDYDYRQPRANFSTMSAGTMDPKQHNYDQLPVYHCLGQGHFNDWDLGERIATLNQDEQQQQYQVIEADSNVRAHLGGATGSLFTLSDHPDAAMNREYMIVGSRSFIKENPGTSGDNDSQTEWGVTLTLTPSNNQYRPQQRTPLAKIHGPQTAVVDGPDSQEIWTNDLGEVKLRFPWDRYAPGQGDSSRWVRVLSHWSGDGWGSEHLPRIGTEVIVMFLDGNPDHPIVIGRVPHTSQIPPTFSNTGALPGNQALAGIKSKELGGSRYNQMLMDDTNGQIRMQLESEHAKTQLNMGYLVHPREGSAEPRGEGFELRTDDWGTLRAAKGLFITTDRRHAAVGNALSRDEING
jgi:type VI secretion system secreted protein VgrG